MEKTKEYFEFKQYLLKRAGVKKELLYFLRRENYGI